MAPNEAAAGVGSVPSHAVWSGAAVAEESAPSAAVKVVAAVLVAVAVAEVAGARSLAAVATPGDDVSGESPPP